MKFRVEADCLWYGERLLGPSSGLYADTKELASLGESDGVKHLHMPRRVDIVFVAGTRVVGVESKKPSDLVSSTMSRRLARQMRTLIEVVDVPALVLRGGFPGWSQIFNEISLREALVNLVRLQCLGVVLLPCSLTDKGALEDLALYRTFLADGSRSALAAVAGTDKDKKKGGVGLLERIRGIGPARAAKLRTRFGSTVGVLVATDEELKGEGVPEKLRERIREAGR